MESQKTWYTWKKLAIGLVFPTLLIAFAVIFWAVSGWLYYSASCETVRTYYYLTHTPGRCLP